MKKILSLVLSVLIAAASISFCVYAEEDTPYFSENEPSGENANEENLITGTRYMNVEGMLPFENMVADYIRETGNHVMYRVTPVFEGDNLVASGVQMEAKSVEDDGEEICYNVYVYNVQPGIEVDYATGDSREAEDTKETVNSDRKNNYILNTNTKKFHFSSCGGAE